MKIYKRHRFPPDIISYAVWLYYRFNLSHRDIEDLLAERGITVSREAIRLWYPKHSLRSWGRLCIKFGAKYAKRLKRRHGGYGDTFFIDKVFVKINGKQHYLWRAVDQDGEVVGVYLQEKRDGTAAKRFFSRLLRSHGGEPSAVSYTDCLYKKRPERSQQGAACRQWWGPCQKLQRGCGRSGRFPAGEPQNGHLLRCTFLK